MWPLVVVFLTLAQSAAAGATVRVSIASSGSQGDADSSSPSLSGNGRFVAFASNADNLVPGDTNGVTDIFVRDVVSGTTERVSVSSSGAQADAASFAPRITPDGRFVVFASNANNLVSGDTNGTTDVFLHDRTTGVTELESVSSSGVQGNGNLGSGAPAVSSDGRFVAFASAATNFLANDANLGADDVFVRDRSLGTTELISLSSTGVQGNSGSVGPSISADGRFVSFDSQATNLVPHDGNGNFDVFVRDRVAGTTTRVSVTSSGAERAGLSGDNSISADGRFVAFDSRASFVRQDTHPFQRCCYDVYIHDLVTAKTELISVSILGTSGNADSRFPSVSADGTLVAFYSKATNLIANDSNGAWDVFVRDRGIPATTTRASVSSSGTAGNLASTLTSISSDGTVVGFESEASNLVTGDTNRAMDIFEHQLS